MLDDKPGLSYDGLPQAGGSCRGTVRVIHIGSKRGMISPETPGVEGLMMPSDLAFARVVDVVLILLVLLSHWRLRGGTAAAPAMKPPRAPRDSKPLAGFPHKPAGPVGAQAAGLHPLAASRAPPPRLIWPRGRRRQVETAGHCCPQASCASRGGVGWGHIRATGHPRGRRGRPRGCRSGKRHFREPHGTPCHGKQGAPDKRVGAIAARATGRGRRAVARVCAVEPNPGRRWRVEAAEPLETVTR
jgi:hypothetical protein